MSFEDDEGGDVLLVSARPEHAGVRVDRVLAELAPALSRARLQALIAEGRVSRDGAPVTSGSDKAAAGAEYEIVVPPATPADPEPQDLPLVVLFEDAHLIVVDKAAGMPAHPSPGHTRGTLVNALLHHCAGSLSGVGGVARPGIVHRLDMDTSGVMVAAKTDAAHAGLAALFAAHDLDREYLALTRGAPRARSGEVETQLGRSSHDRKKMAVLKTGGRRAVTRYLVERTYGAVERPLAARVRCRLETGRTHQIRVHLAHLGAPVLGDPTYGSGAVAAPVRDTIDAAGLTRQALHAAVLGFAHPVTGERLRFDTPPPEDMRRVEAGLDQLASR